MRVDYSNIKRIEPTLIRNFDSRIFYESSFTRASALAAAFF